MFLLANNTNNYKINHNRGQSLVIIIITRLGKCVLFISLEIGAVKWKRDGGSIELSHDLVILLLALHAQQDKISS